MDVGTVYAEPSELHRCHRGLEVWVQVWFLQPGRNFALTFLGAECRGACCANLPPQHTACTHAHMYTHTYMQVHTYAHTYMCTYTYTHAHVHIHAPFCAYNTFMLT